MKKKETYQDFKNNLQEGQSNDGKLMRELNEEKNKAQNLQSELAIYKSTRGTLEENDKYIQDLRKERDELDAKLRNILTDPFFAKQAGNELTKQLHDLEKENKELKEE